MRDQQYKLSRHCNTKYSCSEGRAADAATDHSIDKIRYLWDSRYGSADFLYPKQNLRAITCDIKEYQELLYY